MRSRTLREGSVGLLIIFSIILFGGVILWIRGIQFGEKSYKIIADFADVNGIQLGDGVRYRGLRVGRVDEIKPSANGVDVIIEIDSSTLLIPKDVTLQARSSGLIGETFVDIVPESELSTKIANMSPISSNCDPSKIICDSARLRGEKAVTLDDLLPYTYRFSKAYGEPEFVAKVDSAVENAAIAAGEVANLTRDTSALVKDLQQEVNNVSNIANNTSSELVTTAKSYQETAEQISKLAGNVEQLIAQNKTNLTTTLDSIGTTSDRLQNLVVKIDKTVDATDTEKLAANLEELTNNATVASKNLKDISQSFGSQESLVNLQQTLDSARVTFDNAQKITADLESITGDPVFLENVRILVDGLSNLVSSTEQLEQQMKTSQAIKPMQQTWSISPNRPKIPK
jgi:phospholipid/cholesterol/gamma-HCH transport system substrate-binding protein